MSSLIEVGQVFDTNSGGTVTIVEYINSKNIRIKHNDTYGHEKIVKSGELRRGEIRNPYKPTVCGVGFTGHGRHSPSFNGRHTDSYMTWKTMLGRCYDERYHKRQPTYVGCIVCSEWLNFQIFADWFERQYRRPKWQLDKDLLVSGNKVYSPETCRFVPPTINSLLSDRGNERGDLPLGVKKNGSGFSSRLNIDGENIHLGTYRSPDLAFKAYKEAKEENIKRMAERFKDELDPLIYETLINYEVMP